jgi:hypothetical protein
MKDEFFDHIFVSESRHHHESAWALVPEVFATAQPSRTARFNAASHHIRNRSMYRNAMIIVHRVGHNAADGHTGLIAWLLLWRQSLD